MISRWLMTLTILGIATMTSIALAAEGAADTAKARDYLPPELRSQQAAT